MRQFYLPLLLGLLLPLGCLAQDDLLENLQREQALQKPAVVGTFNGLFLTNLPTNETVPKGDFLFMIVHRFGDIAGPEFQNGGLASLYGLDFVRDYRLALYYGINDRWQVGVGRSQMNARWDFNTRYRIASQRVGGMPVSITVEGNAGIAAEVNGKNALTNVEYYPDFASRVNYVVQGIIAKKFGRFSAVVVPSYLHRNYLLDMGDEYDMFGVGFGTRLQLTKRVTLTTDYYQTLSQYRLDQRQTFHYFPPIGLGTEITVGGHVFQLFVVNNQGILPNFYMTDSRYNYLNGRFRFGFTLSRYFGRGKYRQKMKEMPGQDNRPSGEVDPENVPDTSR